MRCTFRLGLTPDITLSPPVSTESGSRAYEASIRPDDIRAISGIRIRQDSATVETSGRLHQTGDHAQVATQHSQNRGNLRLDTIPPWSPRQEPWRDPRLHAIADAARELDEQRRAWLDPPGVPEAELKKRTLTNLYNARPTWLAHAHAALDRAVWGAYGWDDADPGATAEETILARLLGLNRERCGALKSP